MLPLGVGDGENDDDRDLASFVDSSCVVVETCATIILFAGNFGSEEVERHVNLQWLVGTPSCLLLPQ